MSKQLKNNQYKPYIYFAVVEVASSEH